MFDFATDFAIDLLSSESDSDSSALDFFDFLLLDDFLEADLSDFSPFDFDIFC